MKESWWSVVNLFTYLLVSEDTRSNSQVLTVKVHEYKCVKKSETAWIKWVVIYSVREMLPFQLDTFEQFCAVFRKVWNKLGTI